MNHRVCESTGNRVLLRENMACDASAVQHRAVRTVANAWSAFNAHPPASQGPASGQRPVRLTVTSGGWMSGVVDTSSWFRRGPGIGPRGRRGLRQTGASTKALESADAGPPQGPPWLYAFVLYNGNSEALHDLVCRNHNDLDETTADAVLLTYIGDPGRVGSVYGRMRDARLKARDQKGAEAYRAEARRLGEDFLRGREVHAQRRLFGLPRFRLPCIVFYTDPPCTTPALLKIWPAWLADPDALGEALLDCLEAAKIDRLARECRTTRELRQRTEAVTNQFMMSRLGAGSGDEVPWSPSLILDDIKDGEPRRDLLARIVGHGRFNGADKKIGSRELFFISLLFRSTRSHDDAGVHMTVVTEEEAVQELQRWSDAGYLKFSGADEGKPAYRVRKMWDQFVRGMGKVQSFQELFTPVLRDPSGQRLYAMRIRPNDKQILVPDVPALFKKMAD